MLRRFCDPYKPREKSKSVCDFCEAKLQSEVKTLREATVVHMVTINHTMCDTDHL